MAVLRAFKNFVRGYAPRSLLEWRLDPLAAPGKTLVLYRIAELPDAPRA